jgi:hypothetical protein
MSASPSTTTLTSTAGFDEVFEFYRRSGFLYTAKLAALESRLPAIEATWRALLAADESVFRFWVRHGREGERVVLKNGCAPSPTRRAYGTCSTS